MNQWDFLVKKFEEGRLAHAYVLAGADSEAKKTFARDFVKHISKSVVGAEAAIEKNQFPDLITISSAQSDSSVKNEKDMLEIDIDQIRAVQQFLSYKSYYGGTKAVVIENADRMSAQAQHCFLKTLEEPKGQTLILLLSAKPDMLLPTIASRCQSIRFLGKPAQSTENAQLQSLLKVLQADLAEKFKYAKGVNLEGEQFDNLLQGLVWHFRNLLLGAIGARGDTNLRMTSESTNTYTLPKLQRILALIEKLRYQAATANINNKLALEILLLEI